MLRVILKFTFAFRKVQNNSGINKANMKNTEKIDFKAYYEKLKRKPSELRDDICAKLEISKETFYVKLRNNDFDYPQKVVIAQIVESPIEILFP